MLAHRTKGLGTSSRYLARTTSWNACKLLLLLLSFSLSLLLLLGIVIISIVIVLQEGKGSPAGTSMESSGSNHAAPAGFRFHDSPSAQTTHAEQLLLLPSTTDPSASFDAGLDQAAADDELQQLQKVAHLKVMR